MPKTKVKFLVKPNDSEGNQDIVEFLKTNLRRLNQQNVVIEFRMISKKEIGDLIKKGIDKLPAAYVGEDLYMDSINIKARLTALMKNFGSKTAPPGGKKFMPPPANTEEMMDQYMKREMSREAMEAESKADDDDPKNALMEQVHKEMDRRRREQDSESGKSKQEPYVPRRPDNVSETRTSKLNLPKPKDKDEDMLNKMFEETE